MKPFYLASSQVSASVLLTGCSKNGLVSSENSFVLPTTVTYSTPPKSLYALHKPGLLKAEFLTSGESKSGGMTILYHDKKTKPDAVNNAIERAIQS